MRDYIITLIVFGSVPFILRSPMTGILVWSWLAYMNPHRLCWGFATTMPFAYVIALTILISILMSREDKKIPWTRESIVLSIFVGWMLITTVFAFNQGEAWQQWNKVWKIQLVTFLTLMLMKDIRRINLLVLTIVVSLGFYGFKGGIFTIISGGGYRVWGPDGTFIGGNNEIGLALIMTIPLVRYLQMQEQRLWLKNFYLATMCLSVVSIFGTQSRGAMVGLVAMGIFLIMKGKNRFLYSVLAVVGGILMYQFMPESWHERMGTIRTYEKDGSAMGRLNSWYFAFNLAKDNILGGGFEAFSRDLFRIYAPEPNNFHDAHSIYFEILGEQGFIGLAIFLVLGICTWKSAARIAKEADRSVGAKPLGDLMRMVQVSLVGYASAGAFLGMAYFDLYYALIASVVVSGYVVGQDAKAANAGADNMAKNGIPLRGKPKERTFVRGPIKSG